MSKAFLTLIKRIVVETRFFLGFSLLALFALSWFSIYRTSLSEGRAETLAVREMAQRGELAKPAPKKSDESKKDEASPKAESSSATKPEASPPGDAVARSEPAKDEPKKADGEETASAETKSAGEAAPQPALTEEQRRQRRARGFYQFLGGPDMDMSSGAIATMLLYFLTVGIPIMLPLFWGISRGSAAVAAEIERGTMDMILSRPVSRSAYLLAHVITAVFGYLLMVVVIVAGAKIGESFHSVDSSPRMIALARPALNVVGLGLATYGLTIMFSAFDIVRWRPNMIASILTIAQLVGYAVANQPETADDSWYKVPGKFSVFSTFYPIEAFVKGEYLPRHMGALLGVFAAGVIVALWRFNRRDLPANS
ncbi:ABC transporter permease subunit [bacterium]|nr:ABC transporter permease subunit [bacterium]